MFEKHRLNLLQDDFIDNQKKTKIMGLSMMKLLLDQVIGM